MAPSCAAYGCTQKFNKISNSSITFHRFPKDEALRNEWVRALRRENFTPTIYSRLCSKHFKEEDFYRTALKVRLHSEVIPSVFEAFPEHLQPKITEKRNPPKQRQDADVSTSEEYPAQNSLSEVKNLKLKIIRIEKKLRDSRKEVELLQQTKRRLIEKNNYLNNVICELHRKSILSEESLVAIENCATDVTDLVKS